MKITKEDLKKLNKVSRGKLISLSFGKYYCKNNCGNDLFSSLSLSVNEIIAHYVLEDLGIISPRYFIVLTDELEEKYTLVSENLNTKGNFYTAGDLGLTNIDGSSLYSIWHHLEDNFTKDINVFIDIIKMYLFDIFFLNVDRHISNWGFVMTKSKLKLAVLDNEEILIYDYLVPIISPKLDSEEWFKEVKNIEATYNIKREIIENNIMNNLTSFLNESSKEYIELFEMIYKKLTPEYFYDILNKIEQNEVIFKLDGEMPLIIPNKDILIDIFARNYELITNVYQKYIEERRMR